VDYFLNSLLATGPANAETNIPFYPVDWTSLQNRSYERVKGKIYDKVGLGVDFAEYKQSVSMIASTVTTLVKAARAVRTGRFGDAAKALQMKFIPKGVSVRKSFSNNWLEFHFGWQPLMGDIHDACKVLNDPVKSFSYERAKVTDPYRYLDSHDFGSVIRNWSVIGKQSVTQGCRIKFAKPGSAHTLDQWGISNPLTIVWELIPFSFVVDWFVNVGDFIASQTDFAGMTIESAFQTQYLKVQLQDHYFVKSGFSPNWFSNSTLDILTVNRSTALSGVVLEVKKLKPPSVTRLVTATSLLVQNLTLG